MLLLQLRPVQSYLASKALGVVSTLTNHEISLERIKISWLDRASLGEFLIRDLENDTLIYTKELTINYAIRDILNGNYLSLEEINGKEISVNLVKADSNAQLNLSTFLNAFKLDTTKKESKPIYVDQIEVSDLRLSFMDKSQEHDPTKLDFTNLRFDIPDFNIAEISLVSDTITGSILQMNGVENNSGFTISEFSSKLNLSNHSLSVDDLNFRTPTSYISDSLEFFYNGLDDLGAFVDSVSFILHFNNSRISKEDMRLVLGKDVLYEDITIDGIIWGTVGDFNIEETKFGYGESYFIGGVSCFGLPDLKQTFILADLTDSHVLPSDLRSYIGDYANNLSQMGRIDFTGSFAGFLNDFVARGDFVTDQGSVHTDINLKIPDNPNEMSYDGNLEFKDLNVGAFFQNEIAQVVNLTAAISGKGIQQQNAEFDLKALIYNSGLKGYVYDSVEVDGKFANKFFEGAFAVNDPNCELNGIAQVDFRQIHEILNVSMDIEEINAHKLLLTSNEVSTSGRIDLEVQDLDLDNFTGKLSIDSALLSVDQKSVILDSVRVSSVFEDSTRIIRLDLPGFTSTLKGEFKVSNAINDIPIMAKGYAKELHFITDSIQNEVSGENYKLTLQAQITDVSSYLDSLGLPFSFGNRTVIESTFRQSKNSNISLFIQSDTFMIGEGYIYDPLIEVNGSSNLQGSDILTNFIFESTSQEVPGVPRTENLFLEGVWFDNSIDITTHIAQPATASDVRIESNLLIYRDSLILKMLPSDIKLLDNKWAFNPENGITITDDQTTFSNLEIFDASESIAIDGIYADSIPTSIVVTTEDLNMNKVSLFSEAEIAGFLDGDFKMFRQNASEAFKFDGSFLLKGLYYDEVEIGDISGLSEWDPLSKSIFTKVEVDRENVNSIILEGFYYPTESEDQLDFDLKFDSLDLSMAQPFLIENFTDLEGAASGSLKLVGSTAKPDVLGNFNIANGGVTINYLNTHYLFTGAVNFDPNLMKLEDFHLIDRKGSDAKVNGTIQHNSFRDLFTDILIDAVNFEFLNTTSVDNSLYYGSAYGTGTIEVKGPLNDLNIKADITTEADTRFYVPVSDGTSVSQEDYISFVNFSDTTQIEEEEEFSISGLTLEFDIDITPDAYCELIFDIKTGDIIRGRGRGNLKLRLDTDGDFSMFGPLEIEEGAYNFTIPNFISKEFDVVPGSRISWYGDPYNATIDLDATYSQRASFEELDNPEDRDPALLANKVPILVILELEGGMLSPQIGFDLQLQNESDATNENVPVLSRIRNDEQELKRQVISLLFLKRFSPRESFTLSGGGSVGNSVSEFLSSQVSYLVSQIDENLEVEVNLADLNNEAFNTFQLRFAYTFLNGRLKVTRGGDFGSQDDNNDNVLNDLIGDWSVEYSLTKDGRLRAKVFSNTDQRLQGNNNQQNQELGISLRFVHSFNDLTELLSLKREEALIRREEEVEPQSIPDDEAKDTPNKDSTQK